MIIQKMNKAYIPTEDQEGTNVAGYLLLLQRMGRIKLYSHIPHETYTPSWAARSKNVRNGVRSGVPDYIIVTDKHVLFLELKRTKGGRATPEQKLWLDTLPGKQTQTALCNGFEEAKKCIDTLLKSELVQF